MLPLPANVPARFEPVARLLEGLLVPSRVLAQRWGLSEQTLANDRTAGRGLPFVRLPQGSVRYYVSEIIAAELAGTNGPLSVDRLAIELAAMPDVPEPLAVAIVERLRKAMRPPE